MKGLEEDTRGAGALERGVRAFSREGERRSEIASFSEGSEQSGAENVTDKNEHYTILH